MLGHAHSPGKVVEMQIEKGLKKEPRREQYAALPSFMACVGNRKAVENVGEKSLADCGSEASQFYDAPSSFKIKTNAELS